ncbi:MAG: hypothetical protein N2376_02220, partial [Clostridia bacterium]|nr:hypothetical protein [Clostridia bacterium]
AIHFCCPFFGALEALRYAQLHPGKVKDMVMIDGGSPEFYAKDPDESETLSSIKFTATVRDVGILRLLMYNSKTFFQTAYEQRNGLDKTPAEIRALDTALHVKNIGNYNVLDELKQVRSNAQIVLSGNKLGSIPLRILTSEKESHIKEWLESQHAFTSWSSDSAQHVAPGTDHYITSLHQRK